MCMFYIITYTHIYIYTYIYIYIYEYVYIYLHIYIHIYVYIPICIPISGAAAMLGGICRMTISITVIIVECTTNMNYCMPIALTILCGKDVYMFVYVCVYTRIYICLRIYICTYAYFIHEHVFICI